MSSVKFLFSEADGVAQVILNRPPVNAFSPDMYASFVEAIRRVRDHSNVSVLVIMAEGRLFSAGADINTLNSSAHDSALRRRIMRQALDELSSLDVPIIAGLHGAVIGIGAMLASRADFWIGTEDCFLSLPEINVGVIGGYSHFRDLLPQYVLRRAVFTGERLTSWRLKELGLITEVVSDKECLVSRVHDVAQLIAVHGPEATRSWKRAIVAVERGAATDLLNIEQNFSSELRSLRPRDEVGRE